MTAIFEILNGISCAIRLSTIDMKFDDLSDKVIVDVRLQQDFFQCHIKGSSNIPFNQIEQRMHELPRKSQPLTLFGTSKTLLAAITLLTQKGYQVEDKLIASKETLQDLKDSYQIETGEQLRILWQPASVVTEFSKICDKGSSNLNGLDVACGAGRDSVYLAGKGWNMTSVDYSQTALDKLNSLANNNKVIVKALLIDLEKNYAELEKTNLKFDVILFVRYLHRPMLDKIKTLIEKNGYIVYQTFLEGSEKFGSPKNPRFLLKHGELAEVFSDFDILLDDVEYLDDGRPTNRFIAKKISYI